MKQKFFQGIIGTLRKVVSIGNRQITWSVLVDNRNLMQMC